MTESSACDGMSVTIVNSGVTYLDGSPAPVVITGAGANTNGGSLKDSAGNNPPKVPITVNAGSPVTLYASSGEHSQGQAEGTITIQCNYAASSTGTPKIEVIACNYYGHPQTWSHQGYCNPSGSGGESTDFTVQATSSGQQETGNKTWVQFQVMNGGTSSSTAKSAAAVAPASSTSGTGGKGSST